MDLTTPERPLHEYLAAVCERTNVRSGMPLPLRTYACGEGVNVVFVNRHAGRVRLGLFDYPHDAMAARVVNLAESTRSCSD
jgi:glycogen operon protein